MSINAAIEWDVRTTGVDTNGGGFKRGASGTDYSQQDAAQLSNTDLVLVTASTCSSAGSPFTSAHVGNLIQITAGVNFTTGFYEVLSVAVGVATLDRSAGTSGSTGGTFKLGGALLTISKALTGTASGPSAGAGQRIHIKSGTYTITATITVPNSSDGGNGPLVLIGYNSTHNDYSTTRPEVTSATNSVPIFTLNGGVQTILDNLKISHTAGTRGEGITTTSAIPSIVRVKNCVIDGCNRGIYADHAVVWGIGHLQLFNTEVKNCVSHGVMSSGTVRLDFSYIHNNGGAGVHSTTSTFGGRELYFAHSVLYANTYGLLYDNTMNGDIWTFRNCAFTDNTNDGIRYTGTSSSPIITLTNNVFYNNAGYGINFNGGSPPSAYGNISLGNAYGANGTAPTNNFSPGIESGTITLTGDPFNGRTTADYTLNSTAGAGAALKALGYPGITLFFGTGYSDIGPLQSAGTPAGTGRLVSPGGLCYV